MASTVAQATATADTQALWFDRYGKKVFLFGVNYPWYNGFRGLDFGRLNGSKTIQTTAWNYSVGGGDLQSPSRTIAPGVTGFSDTGIDTQFADMDRIGVRCVRWLLGGDGRAFFEMDSAGVCQGIDTETLQNLDTALAIAGRHRVFVVPVLFDFRFVSGDSWLMYADSTTPGESWAFVLKNAALRARLIDSYVKPLVARYADSDVILYWEILWEAGNVVSGLDTATGATWTGGNAYPAYRRVTPLQMQTFLDEVYDAIKSVDARHPVMPSGTANRWQLGLVVGLVGADLHGSHYSYTNDTNYSQSVHTYAEIKDFLQTTYGVVLDKPLVMTEGVAHVHLDVETYVRRAYEGGWAGYTPWAYGFMTGSNTLLRYYAGARTSLNANETGVRNVSWWRSFGESHAVEFFIPSATSETGLPIAREVTETATQTTVNAPVDSTMVFVQLNLTGGGTTAGALAAAANATGAGANYAETTTLLNPYDTVSIPVWTNQTSMRLFVGLRSDTASLHGAGLPSGITDDDTGRRALGATALLLELAGADGRLIGDSVSTRGLGETIAYTLRYLLSETTVRLYGALGFETRPGQARFGFWYADTYGGRWTHDAQVTVTTETPAAPWALAVNVAGITKDLPGGLGAAVDAQVAASSDGGCVLARWSLHAPFLSCLRDCRDWLLLSFAGRVATTMYYLVFA